MRTGKNRLVWLWAVAAVIAVVVGSGLWKARRNTAIDKSLKPGRGVVTGIFYTDEKPSAVIDTEIVYEGDTVHGVKVVRISRSKVEFEKNGRRWSQQVQEAPAAGWRQAD